MTAPQHASAPMVCGAAAITAPGGPTAVPFRPCCALAIIQVAATCPVFGRAYPAARDDDLSGLAEAAAYPSARSS